VEALERRTQELMQLGFKNFDALHLASAEQAGADVFATCDDQLLAVAERNAATIKVRVVNVVDLVAEVLK
jgi:predicted nucleic acid-binding protein